MNNLEAFTIVRNCALASQQIRTPRGKSALKVMDRKLQSLMRKAAWREGVATTPIHMEVEGFEYPIPGDESLTEAATAICREFDLGLSAEDIAEKEARAKQVLARYFAAPIPPSAELARRE